MTENEMKKYADKAEELPLTKKIDGFIKQVCGVLKEVENLYEELSLVTMKEGDKEVTKEQVDHYMDVCFSWYKFISLIRKGCGEEKEFLEQIKARNDKIVVTLIKYFEVE